MQKVTESSISLELALQK